jgi:hypothetical protein
VEVASGALAYNTAANKVISYSEIQQFITSLCLPTAFSNILYFYGKKIYCEIKAF